MSYERRTEMATDVLNTSGPWAAYWLAFLRVITGWWFLHAGLTKFEFIGGSFGFMWFLKSDSILAPITTWFATNAPWFVEFMVPIGETLIGLGLIFGVLTRLAAFFGGFLMVFFFAVNQGWAHGLVNSDLMGLLLFATLIVFGAGRYYGLDGYLEQTDFVKQRPRLRYLMG
ncbi:MAG: DoxX family protein [Halodesulfurarchaeum sp.]